MKTCQNLIKPQIEINLISVISEKPHIKLVRYIHCDIIKMKITNVLDNNLRYLCQPSLLLTA